MIEISSHAEPIKFDDVKIGQWFRNCNKVYMKTVRNCNGYCAVDTKGNLVKIGVEYVDEILVGTYTVTLT